MSTEDEMMVIVRHMRPIVNYLSDHALLSAVWMYRTVYEGIVVNGNDSVNLDVPDMGPCVIKKESIGPEGTRFKLKMWYRFRGDFDSFYFDKICRGVYLNKSAQIRSPEEVINEIREEPRDENDKKDIFKKLSTIENE